jgi:exodeoxyribonuclease V alpha subunit
VTSVTVTVQKVWPRANGGAVLTGEDDTGKVHRVLASAAVLHRLPNAGETLAIEGSSQVHPHYGVQLRAEKVTPVRPQGELLQRFLARNKAFQGVGEIRSRRLWEAFGEGLYGLLDGKELAPLAEILGENQAKALVEAWGENQAEGQVVRWLEAHGFKPPLAVKVMRLWGTEAPQKILENPYRMLAIADWERVDSAALGLGVTEEAAVRRIAAVEAACYRSMGEKDTVIEERELLHDVAKLLREGSEGSQKALELASEDQAVIKVGEGRWQALGPWVMESYVKERIAMMVAAEFISSGHLLWRVPSDAEVDVLINDFQAENTLQLTDEQKLAVWLALTQRFALLLGGAGTGKTTVLKAVQWAVSKREGTVHAIALAGRAAIRMQEATGYPARTIAGFLGAAERGDLVLGGGDLVVVDEASMVDLPLMYSLLRVIPEDARILLVGDPAQLPPIGMGLVFSVYCEDDRAPKVELTQVHRQAKETGIPILAAQIRRGEMPALGVPSGPGKGIFFIPCSGDEAQEEAIELLGSLGGPGDTQILGAIKSGPAGINVINTALHHLRASGKETWEGFAVDDPVLYLENDYDRKIWNGSLGVVQAAGPLSLSVLWDGHDRGMSMNRGDLENMDLAYAISVHKAQGSQFRRVLVPVFKSRLLDRTLIYTALTRATEQVVFFGDADVLKKAVEAPPAPHRRKHGLGSC